MRKNRVLYIALAVAAGIAAPPDDAAASVVGFASQAAYDAAVGAQAFEIDFDGLGVTLSSGVFLGKVDFGSPEAPDPTQVFFGSDAMTDGGSTIASNFVGPIDGVFLLVQPIRAFRLTFSSSGNPQVVELYRSDATLIGSAISPPNGFFGVLADESIHRFVIRNGEFTPGERDRYFIDDFAVNAVSEPNVLGLLALALGMFALTGQAERLVVRANQKRHG